MQNLLDLDPAGLRALFAARGEPAFRARQVSRWFTSALAADISAMSDLSKASRTALAATAEIRGPTVIRDSTSADGTRKWLLDAGNGNAVEAVYIPERDREDGSRGPFGDATSERDAGVPNDVAAVRAPRASGRDRDNWRTGPTDDAPGDQQAGVPEAAATRGDEPPARYRGTLCVSSQAGCALDCAFCSTGKQGFNRNLTTAEIVGQLWHADRALMADDPEGPWVETRRAPITNVVMMGMGEPLANFDHVVPALRLFLDDNAYGLSRRRVTLSTSGIVPAMDRLARECPVALAVSLHAPNDALRDRLVPINRKHPLAELMAACQRYLDYAPRDFITFEYVMLDGVNDKPEHARELVALVRDVPCKLNLIPFNPFPGTEFTTTPRARIRAFQHTLQDAGLTTTIRKTRGDDIDAACGQLAGRVKDRTKRRLAARIVPVAAS